MSAFLLNVVLCDSRRTALNRGISKLLECARRKECEGGKLLAKKMGEAGPYTTKS